MTKKVIFIIGTLSVGGAERVVSNLSINLPDEIEKSIILFGKSSRLDYEYKGKVIYLDQDDPKGLLRKVVVFLKRLIKLYKIKRNNKDVPIISFLEYPNLLNMLTFNTKKSIISVRNFMSEKHKKGVKSIFWNFSIRYLYKRASQIIAVSKHVRNDLVSNYGLKDSNIRVIYNFYEVDKIYECSKEQLTEEESEIFKKPTIITVGRLSVQKGQHLILQAFQMVKSKIPDVQLVVLGEGELKSELMQKSLNLGISEDIHFWGFKKNPFKYIGNSKVFVMSSYFEGFPNALVEAMACKVPVISTDCRSGPREILDPSNYGNSIDYDLLYNRYGVLVPDPSIETEEVVEQYLAESIIGIINEQSNYKNILLKSVERVNDFNVSKIIDEWHTAIIKS